ncbi:MAG: diacylglycerol/lipid kinase family protein [Candidatus Binatia bacterium]
MIRLWQRPGRKTPIKITLIHNPAAGDGSQPSGDLLVEMIESAGHKVMYQSTKEKDWKKALKKSCDIIAIAGGDGTIGKVARRLVGNTTPVAILPIGTANNIGHALGLTGRVLGSLITEWETARRSSFDIGEAEGPWGSQYFVEGVGVGLFAAMILSIEEQNDPALAAAACREDEIARVLEIFKEQFRKHRPKKMKVLLDNEDLSDDYVLIQALNIRYAGPNLDLAPDADTNDGLLDVVLLRRGEEGRLSRYLSHCIKGNSKKAKLTVHRGRHLQIESNGCPIHIDDKAWSIKNDKHSRPQTIDIKVAPHSVSFICPQRTRRRSRHPRVAV